MKATYHVFCHADPDKNASKRCAFEPTKPGFHFLECGKLDDGRIHCWWVWSGPILIGDLNLLTNGKWRPGWLNGGMKHFSTLEFDTLIQAAKWLNKSDCAKREREKAANSKRLAAAERAVERKQKQARREVEALAKKLNVRLAPCEC